MLADPRRAKELGDINCPVLIIVGEADRETPLAYAEALAAGLPHSTLEVLDGVGHLSPAEAPDRFNRLVAEFLGRPAVGHNGAVTST